MKVDENTVNKLADLSKLEFDEGAKKEIIEDLNKILSFVDKLNELDTDNVDPLIYMTEETNILRKDKVVQKITQAQALINAPEKDSDYILVPKVLDKD